MFEPIELPRVAREALRRQLSGGSYVWFSQE